MNIDDVSDLSHKAWSSMRLAIRSAGLWGHLLVWVVTANVDFCPFREDRFFNELQLALREYFHVADPRTCPLFQERVVGILEDDGASQTLRSEDTVDRVWEDASVVARRRRSSVDVAVARVCLVGVWGRGLGVCF